MTVRRASEDDSANSAGEGTGDVVGQKLGAPEGHRLSVPTFSGISKDFRSY
jgi:hypothetical protein